MRPRIASLLASGTEIACVLGLQDQLVAISHECDHPPEVLDRPRVTRALLDSSRCSAEINAAVRERFAQGAALYEIDIPTLAAARPDIIVTQSQCAVCAVSYRDVCTAVQSEPSLNEAAIVDIHPRTLEGIFEDVVRIGRACGCPAAADTCTKTLRQRVQRIRGLALRLAPQERPSVWCLDWLDPLMLAGHWMPELVEIAGGCYAVPGHGQNGACIEWSALAEADPEVLILMPCGFDLPRTLTEARQLALHEGWRNLRAVRSGRVFAVDGNAYFNRSGPRIVDSLEILFHMLHPGADTPAAGGSGSWMRLA